MPDKVKKEKKKKTAVAPFLVAPALNKPKKPLSCSSAATSTEAQRDTELLQHLQLAQVWCQRILVWAMGMTKQPN